MKKVFLFAILFTLAISACSTAATPSGDQIATAIAQTFAAVPPTQPPQATVT